MGLLLGRLCLYCLGIYDRNIKFPMESWRGRNQSDKSEVDSEKTPGKSSEPGPSDAIEGEAAAEGEDASLSADGKKVESLEDIDELIHEVDPEFKNELADINPDDFSGHEIDKSQTEQDSDSKGAGSPRVHFLKICRRKKRSHWLLLPESS